jgi:hypothetical protein
VSEIAAQAQIRQKSSGARFENTIGDERPSRKKFEEYRNSPENSDSSEEEISSNSPQGSERDTDPETGRVVFGLDVRRLIAAIRGYTSAGRASMVLSTIRDRTSHLGATEINFLATKTMNMLGEAGMWRTCGDILVLLKEMKVGPDSFSVTAAMSVYIRYCFILSSYVI